MVWDVAESLWTGQPSLTTICQAKHIYFCWAPKRPSLLVLADEQHTLYDLGQHGVSQRTLHGGLAMGGPPAWAITPKVSIALP